MIIENILTGNHSFDRSEIRLKHRFVLFNALALFTIIVASNGVVYRFTIHQTIHGLIDLLIVIAFLLVFFLARRSKKSINMLASLVIFLFFVTGTILTYHYQSTLSGINWYAFAFIIAYAFKGNRVSIIVFIFSSSVLLFAALTQQMLSLLEILTSLDQYLPLIFAVYIFYRYNEMLKQELRDQKQRYVHLAHYDSLTEIPNRNALFSFFEDALVSHSSSGTGLAVMFIDLDDFKQINDQYGHARGDQVLRLMAERLRRHIRGSDMLARHGGDEFVIIAQSIMGRQDIEKVLAHIYEAIQEPILDAERSIFITLSIGVAIAPQDGVQIDDLLRHADQAMYHAKKSGKNTYNFYEDIIGS